MVVRASVDTPHGYSRGIPAAPGRAGFRLGPPRSYRLATGVHREGAPRHGGAWRRGGPGQAARRTRGTSTRAPPLGARPLAHLQGKGVARAPARRQPAGRAPFGTGIPAVKRDQQRAPVPTGRLVGHWADQFPPPPSLWARFALRIRLLTANDSTPITGGSRLHRVVSVCRPSARWSAIGAGTRAPCRRACSRVVAPSCLCAKLLARPVPVRLRLAALAAASCSPRRSCRCEEASVRKRRAP